MSGDIGDPAEFIQALRRLAVERPRDARMRVDQLLDENPPELTRLLVHIGAPGEGRLRHIVANSIRNRAERAEVVPKLTDWYALETDEFTKNALRLAIQATRARQFHVSNKAAMSPVDEHLVDAYRYAASRLSHRVRNALVEPRTAMLKLDSVLSELQDPTLQSSLLRIVRQLDSGFQRVARIAEFNADDAYFQMRSVGIRDWLVSMNERYAKDYSPVGLRVMANERAARVRVHASDHLLYTIFWNVWVNAHQAIGDTCHITVRITTSRPSIHLLILDNGDGFSPEARDAAFLHAYSGAPGSSGHSGRGLLEIQEAVEQLHGTVVMAREDDRWRLRITLPEEQVES